MNKFMAILFSFFAMPLSVLAQSSICATTESDAQILLGQARQHCENICVGDFSEVSSGEGGSSSSEDDYGLCFSSYGEATISNLLRRGECTGLGGDISSLEIVPHPNDNLWCLAGACDAPSSSSSSDDGDSSSSSSGSTTPGGGDSMCSPTVDGVYSLWLQLRASCKTAGGANNYAYDFDVSVGEWCVKGKCMVHGVGDNFCLFGYQDVTSVVELLRASCKAAGGADNYTYPWQGGEEFCIEGGCVLSSSSGGDDMICRATSQELAPIMADLIVDCPTGINAGNTHTYNIEYFPGNATGEFCITGLCKFPEASSDSGSDGSSGSGGDDDMCFATQNAAYSLNDSLVSDCMPVYRTSNNYTVVYRLGSSKPFCVTGMCFADCFLETSRSFSSFCGSGEVIRPSNFSDFHICPSAASNPCFFDERVEGLISRGCSEITFRGALFYSLSPSLDSSSWSCGYHMSSGYSGSRYLNMSSNLITSGSGLTTGYRLYRHYSSPFVEASLFGISTCAVVQVVKGADLVYYCHASYTPSPGSSSGPSSSSGSYFCDGVWQDSPCGGSSGSDGGVSSNSVGASSPSGVSSSSGGCAPYPLLSTPADPLNACFATNGKCYKCNPDRGAECGLSWLWTSPSFNSDNIGWWYKEVVCGGENDGSNDCPVNSLLQKKIAPEKDSESSSEDVSYEIWGKKTDFFYDALGRKTKASPTRRYLFAPKKKTLGYEKSYWQFGTISFVLKTTIDGQVEAKHEYAATASSVKKTGTCDCPGDVAWADLTVSLSIKTTVVDNENQNNPLLKIHEDKHVEIYKSLGNSNWEKTVQVNYCQESYESICLRAKQEVIAEFENQLRILVNAQNKWDDDDINNVSDHRIDLQGKLNEMHQKMSNFNCPQVQ